MAGLGFRCYIFWMTSRFANIEPIARALCERVMSVRNDAGEVPALVERYWRVVASQLEAGLIDDDSNDIPHSFEEGEAAWANWLARN